MRDFGHWLARQLQRPHLAPQSWYEAFVWLARGTERQRALIFLDEVAWMSAAEDRSFVGQLKIAWGRRLKKNPELILVLCSSVSSWIERNILKGPDFMGRVSLTLDLRELPLAACNPFFVRQCPAPRRMSLKDRARILCVTGGVPRYLEQIHPGRSAEWNIAALCFRPTGLLVEILREVFSVRAPACRRIVQTLIDGPRTLAQICAALHVAPGLSVQEPCRS